MSFTTDLGFPGNFGKRQGFARVMNECVVASGVLAHETDGLRDTFNRIEGDKATLRLPYLDLMSAASSLRTIIGEVVVERMAIEILIVDLGVDELDVDYSLTYKRLSFCGERLSERLSDLSTAVEILASA